MSEHWVRVDVYLEADTHNQAIERVMDMWSGVGEVWLVDGGVEKPGRVFEGA